MNLINRVVTLHYGARYIHSSELKGIPHSDLLCVCREGTPLNINNVGLISYPTPGNLQINFFGGWGLLIFDTAGTNPAGEKIYYLYNKS